MSGRPRCRSPPTCPGASSRSPSPRTSTVKTGDLMFRIDPEPYRIALAGAEAALARRGSRSSSCAPPTAGGRGGEDGGRRARLQAEGLRSPEGAARQGHRLEGAPRRGRERPAHRRQDALIQGRAAHASRRGPRSAAIRRSRPTSIPMVLAALATRDKAALDLDNTEVTGAGRRRHRAGRTGFRWASMSPARQIRRRCSAWSRPATAGSRPISRKPTSPSMKIGQTATVMIDTYPGHTLEGEVASIGAGTGAEFVAAAGAERHRQLGQGRAARAGAHQASTRR